MPLVSTVQTSCAPSASAGPAYAFASSSGKNSRYPCRRYVAPSKVPIVSRHDAPDSSEQAPHRSVHARRGTVSEAQKSVQSEQKGGRGTWREGPAKRPHPPGVPLLVQIGQYEPVTPRRLRVNLRLLGTEDGGRKLGIWSGYTCQWRSGRKPGDNDARVELDHPLSPGEECTGWLHLLVPRFWEDAVTVGDVLEGREGRSRRRSGHCPGNRHRLASRPAQSGGRSHCHKLMGFRSANL
jgi:hypothetical protein